MYAHRECIQVWINTPKSNHNYDDKGGDSVCEICGQEWNEEMDLEICHHPRLSDKERIIR